MDKLRKQIEEWAALAERATPGPWEYDPYSEHIWGHGEELYRELDAAGEDTAFVCASRTAVPAMAKALLRVMDVIDEERLCCCYEPDVDGAKLLKAITGNGLGDLLERAEAGRKLSTDTKGFA